MDIRGQIADTVDVECWCCKYHENYPMNCYKEPIRTPLCLHRYELADQILNLPVGEERVCDMCKGRGKDYGEGGFDSDFADCPNCNGTGKQPIKTVGEILDEYLGHQ